MITAKSSESKHVITRNSSFFKKLDYFDSEYEDSCDIEKTSQHRNENNENNGQYDNIMDEQLENNTVRRNPTRQRLRPAFLRDDIHNLINFNN